LLSRCHCRTQLRKTRWAVQYWAVLRAPFSAVQWAAAVGRRLVRLSVALPAPPLLRKARRAQAVTAIITMAVISSGLTELGSSLRLSTVRPLLSQ
jgi:hypothetical protein